MRSSKSRKQRPQMGPKDPEEMWLCTQLINEASKTSGLDDRDRPPGVRLTGGRLFFMRWRIRIVMQLSNKFFRGIAHKHGSNGAR